VVEPVGVAAVELVGLVVDTPRRPQPDWLAGAVTATCSDGGEAIGSGFSVSVWTLASVSTP
jgi:hypothetical protein